MSKKSDARRGYTRRQEEEAASPVAEESGAALVTCGECQREIPSDRFEEHWATEHPDLQAGPELGRWEQFAGWMADFGRKLVSRQGLTLTTFLCALVATAFATYGIVGRNDTLAVGGAIFGIALGIIALCLGAPLAGIDLGAWVSRVTGWRPKWQRPSWLRMPELQNSEASRKRIRNTSGITAVFLIAILILWFVLQQPPAEHAAVVGGIPTTPTVVATAPVTPTVAAPTAPITLTVVGRLKTDDSSQNVAGAEVIVENVATTTNDQGEFNNPGVVEAETYHVEINYGEFHKEVVQEPRTGGLNVEGVRADLGELPVVPVAVVQSSETEVEAKTAVETAAQTETHTITVKNGDTVWDLLNKELGHAPTWEQIKSVVDANDLVDKGVDEDTGLWIVLIQIGQTIDLSVGLAVG